VRQLGESLFEVGLGGSSSPAASAGAPRGATGAERARTGALRTLSSLGGRLRHRRLLLDLLDSRVGRRLMGVGRAARRRCVSLVLHQKVVDVTHEAAFL
jgi:hypothetical protein